MKSHKIRCEFSGKPIGHKPVVLCENAILYLRKMGYLVSSFRFLFAFIFLMFILNFTMANSINYDDKLSRDFTTEKLTFKDDFNNVVMETKLVSDDFYYKNSKPHINRGLGYQKTHTFEFTSFKQIDNFINNFLIYDFNKKDYIDKDFDVKIDVYKYKSVPEYSINCSKVDNITIKCNEYISGYYNKTYIDYLDISQYYKNIDLVQGDKINVSIFMHLNSGEYLDIIPIIYNKNLDFWASVSSDIRSGLQAYYKLDEEASASGNIIDSHDYGFDCDNDGADSTTGYINTAYDFVDTNTDGIDCDDTFDINDWDGLTVSFMVKTIDGGDVIMFRDNINNDYFKFRVGIGTNIAKDSSDLFFQEWNGGASSLEVDTSTIDNNDWHHVVVSIDYTLDVVRFYYDGLSISNQSSDSSYTNIDNHFTIGKQANDGSYSNHFDGIIDELAIWNRSLSHGEVLTLNNNNDTIPYDITGDFNNPVVSLISPSNDTVLEYNTYNNTFTCKVKDDINVNNLTLYIWNLTTGNLLFNSFTNTMLNDTNYHFYYNLLSNNTYLWNCLAYDNSSNYAYYNNNFSVSILCIQNLANTSYSDWETLYSCQINDSKSYVRNYTTYDIYNCGYVNTTNNEYNVTDCNFCSYYVLNSSWTDWINISSYCEQNNTNYQYRSITSYDVNNITCYNVTKLPSDLFNNGENQTFYEYRNIACYELSAPVDTGIFDVDLTSPLYIVLLVVLIIIALILAYLNLSFISGFIFVVLGFTLLYSGFNFIISVIVMFLGVGVTFYKR